MNHLGDNYLDKHRYRPQRDIPRVPVKISSVIPDLHILIAYIVNWPAKKMGPNRL